MNAADRPDMLRLYETMATIKTADEKLRSLIQSGQVMLAYYSPRGQEAIPAGMSLDLQASDYLVTTYRGLHDQIAKGVPLGPLFAEYLGRSTGLCKGKGGGMHVTHPASGVMVTTGIVGSGLPIANGLALASTLRADGAVTVVNFGDGASNIGAFHEALNLASVWKLPVIFSCQNNRYAEHTAYAKATSVASVSDRATAYSMPGVQVDGSDPVAVLAAARDAIARARAGEGPTLIEALTYRFCGHYFGEDTHYMPAEEVAAAQAADPVTVFRARLLEEGHALDEDLTTLEKRIQGEVDEAASFAMGSGFVDADELRRDVYVEELV